MTTATTPHVAFATAFDVLMRHLLGVIAARFLKNPRLAPFILILWKRLVTSTRRMHAAMARIAQGRPPRTAPGKPRATPPAKPRPSLPRGFGWLLRELKHEAAIIGAQLETLIAEPEIAAILAANPSARRILNPIRHALGHGTPRPTRPRVPRAEHAPRAPRAERVPRPPRPRREKPARSVALMPCRRPFSRKSD